HGPEALAVAGAGDPAGERELPGRRLPVEREDGDARAGLLRRSGTRFFLRHCRAILKSVPLRQGDANRSREGAAEALPVQSSRMPHQLRGRLDIFSFADLLQWMELNRRSGRLTVSRGPDRRAIDWKDGEIVYVSGSLPRHRLGIHLLRSGALPASTLYELLARSFTGGGTLSRLILDAGFDTHDGLSLRVEELARKLLFEMFEWREARFEYDPDFHVVRILRIGLSMRGQALALQGAKASDD